MKKTFIALVLILSFFVTDTAMACKPGGNWPPSAKENVAQKDAVFIGTVQSVMQDKSVNGEYRISFKVDQKYKGALGESVVVKTQSSSAACGYDAGYDTFKVGTVWVIYATGNTVEGYSTNSLSLNTSYGSVALAASALTTLGITAPKDEPVMCTMQYAPVCGKSPAGVTKTYGNSCTLGADKATFLYEGECKDAVTTPTVTPPVITTPVPSVETDVETTVSADVTPAALTSVWQKIVLGFKSLFSFLK